MEIACSRCVALERENERLKLRVEEMEGLTAETAPIPRVFGLTEIESRIVLALLSRASMTHEQLLCFTYSDPDRYPSSNSLQAMISKARKKLAPHGVFICRYYGVGYFMPADSKARLRAAVAEVVGQSQEAA